MPKTSEDYIDTQVIHGLGMYLSSRKRDDILKSFSTDSYNIITQMDNYARQEDFEAVSKCCHMLISTSAQIGAVKLEEFVRYIHKRSLQKKLHIKEIDNLRDILHETVAEIEEVLKQNS